MVRIMRRTENGGYEFDNNSPSFTRKQEALQHIRANAEEKAGTEFLIVGSPTTVVTETQTKVTLKTTNVSRKTK